MRQAIRFTLLLGLVIFQSTTNVPPAFGAPPVDLAVSMTAEPEAVMTGATVTYTITVTYNDHTPAKDVVLTDTLPSDALYVSASSTQGACSYESGTVTCRIGGMSNNSSTVTATILATAPLAAGDMSNSVTVTSSTADPDVTNNTALQLTTVNLPTLTVIVTGEGTVQNSSDTIGIPKDINCTAGACFAAYPLGSTVRLTATPSWYSTIVWNGCNAAGNNICRVLVNGDTSVNASFNQNNNVRLNYSAPHYSRIMDAYDAIGLSGIGIIQAQVFSFLENPVFGKPVAVVLEGGRDAAFGPAQGYSAVGPVRISSGRVTFRNVVIR